MTDLEKKLTVEINKVFHSFDFNQAFCEKFNYAPSGMTLNITEDFSRLGINRFTPTLMVKHYGFESSSNNGLDIYSDLLDYDVGHENFSDEQIKFVLDYFKHNYPNIYKYFNI